MVDKLFAVDLSHSRSNTGLYVVYLDWGLNLSLDQVPLCCLSIFVVEYILHSEQQLMTVASNRWIASKVNCAPTYVATVSKLSRVFDSQIVYRPWSLQPLQFLYHWISEYIKHPFSMYRSNHTINNACKHVWLLVSHSQMTFFYIGTGSTPIHGLAMQD